MKTYENTALYKLKKNDKFTYNGIVYTVFDQAPEGNMTEVWAINRFWAWSNCAVVTPISY